jgi:acetoin utilization deacetylase AcuC-like enzyme
MSLILISSERFAEHQTPPGHPESPERARVMDVVVDVWRTKGLEIVAPREAIDAQLARVHDRAYLERIDGLTGQAVALDPDTYTSPETVDVARLAAGAAIDAVERVMAQAHVRAMALVRPPGHHAERGRAMGFCFYNNVAVAAAHARSLGAAKVAIVDYDVHHGNGTEHIFEDDPSVLYVSLHQYPYYPGTGAAHEIGSGAGKGFTVNLPLEVGAVDEDYRLVFAEIVGPVVRQFAPDLLLVSAGFDAHERDPLGGMRVTTEGFAAMTMDLRQLADECCEGRIVAVTEGGYDLAALGDSLHAAIAVFAADRAEAARWPSSATNPSRGLKTAEQVKPLLKQFWRL